jgi:hypothetical protein
MCARKHVSHAYVNTNPSWLHGWMCPIVLTCIRVPATMCSSPQVEERLAQLGNLLPDIVGKMDRARADVLYELLKDPAATAERLLALREVLPRCNVSALVAGHPKLMLGMTVSWADCVGVSLVCWVG